MKSMVSKILATVVVITISGCGALVENTDVPRGPYVSAPDLPDVGDVRQAENVPQSGGVRLSGISCKNRLWDPNPTNEKAILTLKREAQKAGFNSVHVTSVEPMSGAVTINCWSAIEAKGTAFNS